MRRFEEKPPISTDFDHHDLVYILSIYICDKCRSVRKNINRKIIDSVLVKNQISRKKNVFIRLRFSKFL